MHNINEQKEDRYLTTNIHMHRESNKCIRESIKEMYYTTHICQILSKNTICALYFSSSKRFYRDIALLAHRE